jgi:hypothetical protein
MNGFVFIEGRYLSPPYTVTRKGNGIFINRIQIEQKPVSLALFSSTDADRVTDHAPAKTPAKKSVDADGDFEVVNVAAKPTAAADPAASADPAAAAEPAAAAPVKPKTVKSIDDLFDDDTPAKPAPAAAPVAAAPAAADEAAPQPSVAEPAATELTADDVKRQKAAAVAGLERLRKGYEQALAQSEFFFFSSRNNRVNGNYGTARALMSVLPKALRYAQSPQGLLQRLNEGNVYFIDLGTCVALFKNKNTFPMLEERWAKIEEAEAFESQKRQSATRW